MNELVTPQKCIQIRSGVEIWLDGRKADALADEVDRREKAGIRGTFKFEGRLINIADIVGIFKPEDMESSTRRKNGEWMCHAGAWHSKGEKCDCLSMTEKNAIKRREEAIKACGKCTAGYRQNPDGSASLCECLANLV